jgi:predicted RNA-binding protein with PIN domain
LSELAPSGWETYRCPSCTCRVAAGDELSDTLPEMSVSPDLARLWIVDGYNLLHACLLPEGKRSRWWSSLHQQRVCAVLERFALRHPVWVVFDASVPRVSERLTGSLVVKHAVDADEFIVSTVATLVHERALSVVSADRSLCDRCTALGAERLSPWALREWLAF